MYEYVVKNHVSSILPEGKKWKLIWNDEFDGSELDRSKWDFRLNFWGSRFKAFTDEEAIKFDGNSNIELHLLKKGDDYVAPLLQTGSLTYDIPRDSNGFWPFGEMHEPKFAHKYGYYECRCKLQTQPGWWSAFWLQAPGIGATLNAEQCGVEVDIMESFAPGYIVPHMMHWNGYGKNHKQMNTTGKPDFTTGKPDKNGNPTIDERIPVSLNEYHIFGMLWEKNGYTFYIDGKQSGIKLTSEMMPVSDTEQFILIHGECLGYRANNGQGSPCKDVKNAVLPDCFIVDYVRVFDFENI
jgi:beta-glucanase (GH16 family)